MKRLSTLVLIAISLGSARAQAQVNPNIHLPTYADLCGRIDPEMCGKAVRVNHGQLVYTKPSAHHLDYYKPAPMRAAIIRIARLYKVDAVALVLAPLAENSMNTNIKRMLEEYGASTSSQLDDDGYPTNLVERAAVMAYLQHPLSIGPGQIYVSAAKHVEKLAASIEHRAVRTKGHDIKEALLTPEGALKYAAAIMRDAQDTFAKYGMDISRRPEIVTTLYNLGKVEQLARSAKSNNHNPDPNYFGYFAGMNYDYVRQYLNLPSVFDQPAK